VAMEETLNPVVTEIICATTMIPMVAHKPASPTIIGSLKYMITPRIVKIEGTNTPPNVPNLELFAILNYKKMIFSL
jgi:hypothetical protein